MEPRIDDPIGFARKNRVLLLHHGTTGVEDIEAIAANDSALDREQIHILGGAVW